MVTGGGLVVILALVIATIFAVEGVHLNAWNSNQQPPKTINLPLTLITGYALQGPMYLINISIGTPPQTVTVQVDTGSADLWVFADKVVCNVTLGCHGGRFNPTASSTFAKDLPGYFKFSYGSGNSGDGDYFKDNVHIGNATVKNFRIGLANRATGQEGLWGIMGLAFPGAEFLVNQNHPELEYPVFVMELAKQGFINSAAFSIYLNDQHAKGSLLLGGIDQAKYTGDMKELKVLPVSDGSYDIWYLNLTTVGYTIGTKTKWYNDTFVAGPAFLDSGAPKAFLPAKTSIPLLESVGATYRQDLGISIIPCSAATTATATTTVNFLLGGDKGVVVKVPLKSLIDPYPDPNPPKIHDEIACSFGISPGPDGFMVLGDAFLRGVYAVFNMDKKTVGLAAVKLNETNSNVVPIKN